MKIKLSRYLVITDPLNNNEKKIITSLRTNKLIVVSRQLVEILYSDNFNEIPRSLLNKLIDYKILVPENEDELEVVLLENEISTKPENKKVLTKIIHPTSWCQLACVYCGQQHEPKFLSNDFGKKIIARIERDLKKREYKKLIVKWFGGEPLVGLKKMEELSRSIIEITKNYNISYSSVVVTNGLKLNNKVFTKLVENLFVENIEITLDGYLHYHDKNRPTKSGKKTYNRILNNVENILSLKKSNGYNCKITIRCNVNKDNYLGVVPLIQDLKKRNIHNQIDKLYTYPVFSWAGNNAHEISLNMKEYSLKEINWILEKIKCGYNNSFGLPKRKKNICTVLNDEVEVIDVNGNIYNCTEVSYSQNYSANQYRIGHISDDSLKLENPFSNYLDLIRNNTYECYSCKFLPVCGGRCPKKRLEGNIDCPSFKYNIEDKIKLFYLLNDNNYSLDESLSIFSTHLKSVKQIIHD